MHPKLFSSLFRISFFFQTRIRGQISAYLTSRVAVTWRVPSTYSRIPHCILFTTDPKGIPFQTLRKGWPLHQGLHPLLSNYPLPVKYRILSTSSQIPHCILLSSRIGSILPDPVFWFSSRLIMLLYNMRYWGHSGGFRGANLSARQERGRKREK